MIYLTTLTLFLYIYSWTMEAIPQAHVSPQPTPQDILPILEQTQITDKQLKRAGMDYWYDVDVTYYENLQEFLEQHKDDELFLLSTKSKQNHKTMVITGMRAEEGGNRARLGCLTEHNTKFHPLIKVDDEWENMFVEKNNIELALLYYPPFNFKRTGCKGCPYSLDLQEQLEIMEKHLPNERKQCEFIWQPVYQEYRRLNYRLKNVENIKLF